MGIIKYTISGNTPSKKNTKKFARATGRTYYSKTFLEWQKAALWELKAQKRPDVPLKKTEHVILRFWRQNLRTADNTNLAEAPMDALVKMGILDDDNFKVCPGTQQMFMGVDKKNPRVEIEIIYDPELNQE